MEQKSKNSEWEVSNLDFDCYSTFTLRCSLDSRGPQTEFEWTDFSSAVFRNIQDFNEVDADDYTNSIRSPETLRLLLQAKKNSSFYLSCDDLFVLKLINKSEMKVFLEMLPRYYQHIQKYKNTLLTKFYGLHVVKPITSQKQVKHPQKNSHGRASSALYPGHRHSSRVCFVVTGNILRSDLTIHKQLNLKIASQNRNISRTGNDEELNMTFHLQPLVQRQFHTQIKCDCNFLEEVGIMNYNFSLAMHVCAAPFEAVMKGRRASFLLSGSDGYSRKICDGSVSTNDNAAQDPTSAKDLEPSNPSGPACRLGVKIGARAVDSSKKEYGLASNHNAGNQLNNVILYFGITNILQGYGMRKHVEHVLKTLQSDTPGGSATNPRTYSSRFQEQICKVFPENDDEDSKP